jgi:hypothetical protein
MVDVLIGTGIIYDIIGKEPRFFFVFFLGACNNVGLDTGFFAVDIGVLTSFAILL